jgi:hypothetical protein
VRRERKHAQPIAKPKVAIPNVAKVAITLRVMMFWPSLSAVILHAPAARSG